MGLLDKPILAPKEFKKEFQHVTDYLCPNCGMEPVSYYEIKGEGFPKWYNESSWHTDMGNFYYWEEYHICEATDCRTKFWFENGN